MVDILALCQLLNSHLCHEISGPISAINNSLELINSANLEIKNNATELLKDANDELVKKIKFYSHVYSISQSSETISFELIKELCLGYFSNSNVTLDFSVNNPSCTIKTELSKALMCIVITAYKNLLKGGLVKVIYHNLNNNVIISVRVTDEKLYHNPEKVKLLLGDEKIEPNFFNCNEYYITMLNNKMGYKLNITHLNNTIEYSYVI